MKTQYKYTTFDAEYKPIINTGDLTDILNKLSLGITIRDIEGIQ